MKIKGVSAKIPVKLSAKTGNLSINFCFFFKLPGFLYTVTPALIMKYSTCALKRVGSSSWRFEKENEVENLCSDKGKIFVFIRTQGAKTLIKPGHQSSQIPASFILLHKNINKTFS